MPIVTLTTDFGWQDYYLGMLKGALLCEDPELNIIDVSHNIKDYDIVKAAFILKNVYSEFPKGTIHILSVNNFYKPNSRFIAVYEDGHFFLGPDNGVFSLVFDQVPRNVFELDYAPETGWPLKNIYAKAVAYILSGRPIGEIGLPLKGMEERITLQPVMSKNQIRGSVIHVDNYENVILNITQDTFSKVRNGRSFALYFKRNDPITRLSRHYYDVPTGEVLCLFNSAGYLEIAIHHGKAASLLGLKPDDTVQIDFG